MHELTQNPEVRGEGWPKFIHTLNPHFFKKNEKKFGDGIWGYDLGGVTIVAKPRQKTGTTKKKWRKKMSLLNRRAKNSEIELIPRDDENPSVPGIANVRTGMIY